MPRTPKTHQYRVLEMNQTKTKLQNENIFPQKGVSLFYYLESLGCDFYGRAQYSNLDCEFLIAI